MKVIPTMVLVEDITKYYEDDLPSPTTLQQELHIWHSKWKCVENSNLPSHRVVSLADPFPTLKGVKHETSHQAH